MAFVATCSMSASGPNRTFGRTRSISASDPLRTLAVLCRQSRRRLTWGALVGAYSGRKDPHHSCHPPTSSPARPSLRPSRPGTRRGRRSATGAALRAGAVSETAGGRRAGQSELRLPRRTGKSQPADRSHNSAHGREIPCTLTGEAARSRCLSGRRAGRHRPPGGQRAHRCRFHPRP